jgi:two-component system sensor histidine kinase GlrK
MKVSTRIVTGFGILLTVSLATTLYQTLMIQRMQSINKDLSQVNFEAAGIVQNMNQEMFDLEDYSRKYFVLNGDPLYEKELDSVRSDFISDLSRLDLKARTPREREAIKGLSLSWNDFWLSFGSEKARLKGDSDDATSGDLPESLQNALDKIRERTETVMAAVRVGIKEQVDSAAANGARARSVSLVTGVLSLLIAIVVAVVVVRAIADPLRQLAQGTRRISKGQFWHRLPSDGRDEFADLARDFNLMAQRLAELDGMKKDFVSHVSHELKAPLASMRQVFLLLLQEIAGPLSEQQRRLLSLSSKSAERLAAMVGNLLDVSRMEVGSMEYTMQPHDIGALVQTVSDEFEVQANERQIRLKVSSDAVARAECDRERIVQVIGNLFENALKFAPEGSEILAKIERPEKHKIMVSVADSGSGVPDAHKQKIFEKFHQVKKGRKIAGQGVGLGLAICKTIVEAHGGSIWVEDNPGGGSVFRFTLSAAPSPLGSPAGDSVSVTA